MESTQLFLQDLASRTQAILRYIGEISRNEDAAMLTLRPSPEKWSVADCIEHLSLYGDFYLPAFEKAIQKGKQKNWKRRPRFQSGWLGARFVRMMKPQEEGGLKPMATFRDKNPIHSGIPSDSIPRFLQQQNQLLDLLKQAGLVDLQRLKVPISIAPWMKIRLGDAIAFFIAHEERHMRQIQKTLHLVSFSGTESVK